MSQDPQKVRPALTTPTRLILLERTADDHDRRIVNVELRVDVAESRLDVLTTKVGLYAALGALIGGGVVSGIVAAIFHFH